MAITRSDSELDVVLDAVRTFFHHSRNKIENALAKRKIYRSTYCELSALTDRDLRDLGIPRSNIKKLALEAAYDC